MLIKKESNKIIDLFEVDKNHIKTPNIYIIDTFYML